MEPIKITNRTYYDELGRIVSKEEWEKSRKKFENDVGKAYNSIADKMLSRINSIASNDFEKLWLLYNILLKKICNMICKEYYQVEEGLYLQNMILHHIQLGKLLKAQNIQHY